MSWWTPARADVITDWNATTLSCVQGPPAPANRPGPAGLLDVALVQLAVHDAVQAIEGKFAAYEYASRAHRAQGSPAAAAAAAAHGVLTGLYGAEAPCLDGVPAPDEAYAGDSGLVAGAEAAAALLALHRPAQVLPSDPFLGGTKAGEWRPTPGTTQGAFTFLAETEPFGMKSPGQFRPPPPPSLRSRRYARDYDEVKALGALTGSARTAEQTDLAQFWSANYFSQWNEALRAIAREHVTDIGDAARLFALVAMAAADSQISVYDAKYHYNLWRPITAIHGGDSDGNRFTRGDPAWAPLLSTPAYPEYSSGANCLVSSITTMLKLHFGTDHLRFSVWSTSPNIMQNPRSFERFSDAAREVVEARILQGIHFRTADEVGRRQGARIARWIWSGYLRPLARGE